MGVTLDSEFEKFLGGPNEPVERRIHVTLSDRGTLTLNARCYAEIGKPPAAYLHFSRKAETIAVEPVESARLPTAFPFQNNHGARYLNAAPFIRHFGIKLDATHRFIRPELRDGALYLNLRETAIVTRRRRMQRKKPD
jgi:hypothetical protein